MLYLWVVSLIWAFSFGLIKGNLAGLDPHFVAGVRLGIALVVFLPFLRLKDVPGRLAGRLAGIGAVQFGVMYITYNAAYAYLQAYEIALFTIFTPLYVTLIEDVRQRKFQPLHLGLAVLAVLGTAVVKYGGERQAEVWTGFLLVQASNLCFAFGQVAYRAVLSRRRGQDLHIFGLVYLGGFLAAAVSSAIFTDWEALRVSSTQTWTLIYLGAVASGLGFFLWNAGARRVAVGTLAVFNDLKVPLAVLVSLVFFGEQANWLRLVVGGGIVLGALGLSERQAQRTPRQQNKVPAA